MSLKLNNMYVRDLLKTKLRKYDREQSSTLWETTIFFSTVFVVIPLIMLAKRIWSKITQKRSSFSFRSGTKNIVY